MNAYFELITCAAVLFTEMLINYIYADYLFTKRVGGAKAFGAYAVGYVLLYTVFLLPDKIILNIIAYLLVNFMIFAAVYYCGIVSALFNSAVLTALMAISEVIGSAVLSIPSGSFSSYTYSPVSLFALSILSKLLYMLFCITSASVFEPHKSKSGSSANLIKLSIMPVASLFVAVLVIYVYSYIELPYVLQIAAAVSMFALLFANIYTVSVYNRSEKISRENLAIKLAVQKEEYDAEYYKMLEEQYERQRILIHDVKNHMQAINGLAAEGNVSEIQKYITEWGYDKALQKQVRYCQNSILNIIVSETARECAESGIEFQCDIRGKSVDFISDTDISALFGNLLSNAYEAAKNADEKFIELDIKIKPEQKLTVVKISNSCKEPPVRDEKGLFISRKDGKENHGLGQKSIRRIIEKYGGTSESYYNDSEKRFETVIVFSECE